MLPHLLMAAIGKPTLLQAIQSAGLTTNLKVCLDASDPASYTSGQKWLDLSGNGYDFFLGADVNVAADDPTFTGNVGAYTSYFLYDGGDLFVYDTTNETWMQNLHKDNAIFSIVMFHYAVAASGTYGFSTSVLNTEIGIRILSGVSGINQQIVIDDGSGSAALNVSGDSFPTQDAWNMVGYSLTEATGAGGGFLYLNGGYNQVSASNTFNSAYTTPSASNATYTAAIGGINNGTTFSTANTRIACIAVWEGTAITKANMDTIWALMRGRFGL